MCGSWSAGRSAGRRWCAKLHHFARVGPRADRDVVGPSRWIAFKRLVLGDDWNLAADERRIIAVGNAENAKQSRHAKAESCTEREFGRLGHTGRKIVELRDDKACAEPEGDAEETGDIEIRNGYLLMVTRPSSGPPKIVALCQTAAKFVAPEAWWDQS